MPDLALPRQLHAIGRRAVAEATVRCTGSVGAEHILLAIAAEPGTPVARVLAESGLDYLGIAAALADERRRSLAVADVESIEASLLVSVPRTSRPGWGASVRDLLRAADKPAAKSAARSGVTGALERELVIGILQAGLGTVPRMLAIAGIDRLALIARLRP